ncbi:hypothetical protein B0I37DRAFT_413388 [Chaetomium sp. MPI-CAGE-AT-0009]|nr:hypothetical protein B0I37DRAFT_413388 [Chaetomium sp. MPI-CAGE-AT-0009]
MPRLPGEQQNLYYAPAHQQRQQYRPQQQAPFQPSPITTTYPTSTHYNSPVSPLGTPGSISPTSSKNYITRQIRPLYVPAVLRPTEFPSKPAPLEPNVEDDDDIIEDGLRPSSSFMSLGGLSAFGRLSRRSTGDSAKSVGSMWNLDQFPKPTGPPTRRHWKADHESTICDHATCKRYFSYFTRRHHCRKCGNIFCDQHSTFEIPLDQDANFNPRGGVAEASNWQATKRRLAQRHPHHPQLETPSTPVSASPTAANLGGLPLHTPDAAHSVPRDWNWSTF